MLEGLVAVSTGECKLCNSAEPRLLYQPIHNFERMISSGRQRELINFVTIGSTGAAPHVGLTHRSRFSVFVAVNIFFSLLFLFRQALIRSADHNKLRISMRDSSKDVVWRKNVPYMRV
jgi:hypothetical protein